MSGARYCYVVPMFYRRTRPCTKYSIDLFYWSQNVWVSPAHTLSSFAVANAAVAIIALAFLIFAIIHSYNYCFAVRGFIEPPNKGWHRFRRAARCDLACRPARASYCLWIRNRAASQRVPAVPHHMYLEHTAVQRHAINSSTVTNSYWQGPECHRYHPWVDVEIDRKKSNFRENSRH